MIHGPRRIKTLSFIVGSWNTNEKRPRTKSDETGCSVEHGMKTFGMILALALVALPACSRLQVANHPAQRVPAVEPAQETKPPVSMDLDAERTKLVQTDIAFSRLCEEKGAAEAFYEFLAPDAVSLPAGEFPIKGRDAIRVQLSAGPKGILTWKPTEAEIARSGDLGYTWGTYESTTTGPDQRPNIGYGKYVTIWKKQPDGTWKVALDAGNPSPPPTQRR